MAFVLQQRGFQTQSSPTAKKIITPKYKLKLMSAAQSKKKKPWPTEALKTLLTSEEPGFNYKAFKHKWWIWLTQDILKGDDILKGMIFTVAVRSTSENEANYHHWNLGFQTWKTQMWKMLPCDLNCHFQTPNTRATGLNLILHSLIYKLHKWKMI